MSLELGEAGGDIRLSRTTDGTVLDLEGDRWTGLTTDKILLPEESRMVLPNLNDFGRVELLLEEERNLIFDDTTAWRLGTPLVDGQRFLRGLRGQEDSSEVIYIEGGAAWQLVGHPPHRARAASRWWREPPQRVVLSHTNTPTNGWR